MVNTILAKRVNHIVAKGDHPVWPKGAKSHGFSNITVMSHYFIDRQDPRVADLLRRLGNIGQALGQVESVARPMFKGDRFLTDEELSRLLKVSRRTLQEYRTARLIPYYIVQGKALYRESEIQSLLEKAHRKCVEEQKWL